MLRATVGVPLAGQFAIDDVVATGETTYTLTQGSMEIEIVPLSYKDYTVEDFYDYYDADANTPTNLEKEDTTRLFLFEGPNDELSLVIIHDKPYSNGTGGEATYDFSGLPDTGEWVVKDGPPDSYSRTRCEWKWSYEHTDGGAFRGGLAGTEFIISPQKQGTSNFEALSGSASNPTVTKLDSLEDVGLAPKRMSLEKIINQKLDLAEHIDELNTFGNINEYSRVSDNMDIIRGEIDSGNYRKSDAVDVVSRMKYSENVAETSVAVLGPASIPVGEDENTLIGADPDRDSWAAEGENLAQNVVLNILGILVGIVTYVRLLAKARKAAEVTNIAINILSSIIEELIPYGPEIINTINDIVDKIMDWAYSASDTVISYIEDNGLDENDSEQIADYVLSNVVTPDTPAVKEIVEWLVDKLEGKGFANLDSIEETMESTDSALMDYIPSDPLAGSRTEANSAMNNGLQRINNHVDEANSIPLTIAGILAAIFAAGLAGGIISWGGSTLMSVLVAGAIAAVISVPYDIVQLHKNWEAIQNILETYDLTADAIVRGENI